MEYSQNEIDEYKLRTQDLEDKEKANKLTIDTLNADVKKLKQKCQYLEDSSRRNNLLFEGFPDGPNESWEKSGTLVEDLIRDRLDIKE